jgi:hypothetical protein
MMKKISLRLILKFHSFVSSGGWKNKKKYYLMFVLKSILYFLIYSHQIGKKKSSLRETGGLQLDGQILDSCLHRQSHREL